MKDPTKVVNQYVLADLLGKGGMGQVCKAWDTKLSRWVALKFLTVTDETNLKRFEREAKIAARLRHPNIAAVYEVGEEKGRHYIAMEFVDGTSLGKADLPLRKAVEVVSQIARALQEAHKEGVIHRDLKPENLMVTKAGRPYVMDFGLAKAVEAESSLSVSGDVMGTPVFMSPEQARGEVDDLDARTDVYSLGATLYALITGEKPFSGRTSIEIVMKVVHQDPPPPRSIKRDIPAAIEAVVMKAMEKSRDRRYPTADALADDLDRFLGNQDVEAKAPTVADRLVRRVRRNAWLSVSVVLGVMLLGLGLFLWNTGSPPPPPPSDGGWSKAFREARHPLEYRAFAPGDPELPKRIHAIIASGDAQEAAEWLKKEVEMAESSAELWEGRPRSEWMTLRDSATRGGTWADAASQAILGLPGEFPALAKRLSDLKGRVKPIASWRGEFTLRVAAVPLGQVRFLKRGGQEIPLKDSETPLVLPDLEIDDYEIRVEAASGTGVTVPIPASRLRDGITSTLSGDLRKAETVILKP
jgi:predicted Ser/Thr protein kinase